MIPSAMAIIATTLFFISNSFIYSCSNFDANTTYLKAQSDIRDNKLWLEPHITDIQKQMGFTNLQNSYYWSWMMLDESLITLDQLQQIKQSRNQFITLRSIKDQISIILTDHWHIILKFALTLIAINYIVINTMFILSRFTLISFVTLFFISFYIYLVIWMKLPGRLLSILEASFFLAAFWLFSSYSKQSSTSQAPNTTMRRFQYLVSISLLFSFVSPTELLSVLRFGCDWQSTKYAESHRKQIETAIAEYKIEKVMILQFDLLMTRPFSKSSFHNCGLVPAGHYSQTAVFPLSTNGLSRGDYPTAFLREQSTVWLLGNSNQAEMVRQLLCVKTKKTVKVADTVNIGDDTAFFKYAVLQ
jgi:hypothetical protein